nr:hypothetical protein [Tanacetum cinerariifolium]
VEAKLVEFKTQEIKFCEKIRGLERDVEVKNNKIEYLVNELEQVKKEKEGLDNKLTGFESASNDLDNLLGSQRSHKNKPIPSIDTSKSNTSDLQSRNFSVSELEESSGSIMSKPMIKFVKATDCPKVIKINNTKTARKSTVKYAEMYMNISKGPKVEAKLVEFKTQEIKFCEKIKGLERDVEVKNNKIEYLVNELEQVKKEKEGLDNKLTGFESASKDLDNLLGSQRSHKNKPIPSIDTSKSSTSDLQSRNFSVSELEESLGSIMSKPMIKFVKATDCPKVIKINNTKTARKSTMKYAEMYMNISKGPKVRGNQ